MSIVQIGRVFDGLDVDVAQASWRGNVVTLSGDLNLSAVTAANRPGTAAAVRDRINALVGSRDELAVPVVWSEDSSVDGFYVPLDSSVAFSNVSLNDGYLQWQATLRRIGDGSLPVVEVKSMYGVVTNPWAITNTTLTNNYSLESACPSVVYTHWNGYNPANGVGRNTETGNMFTFINVPAGSPSAPSEVTHVWSVDPDDAYIGACSLKGTYAGVASQLCLGRQMTPTAATMVLSNGMVRVSVDGASSRFKIEFYDDPSWVTVGPDTWKVSIDGGAVVVNANTRLTILRNSPEQASVRLVGPSAMGAYGPVSIDLTVNRGAPYVLGVVRTAAVTYSTIKPQTATACTSLDGGFRQTSNDANGNRFVVTAGNNGDGTRNLTTGELGQSTSVNRTFFFGVGVEVNGSGASTNQIAQNVEYQMLSGRSETQRIVTR